MTTLAGQAYFDVTDIPNGSLKHMPEVTITPWGYIVGATDMTKSPGVRSVAARFFGMVLFLAGLTIGLVPEPASGTGLTAMKLGAMVLFMLVGGVMVWAGRQRPGTELHVDLTKQILRLGGRDIKGEFRPADILRFEDVTSVFILRSTTRGKAARLFLRLGQDVAVEIANGNKTAMERLRQRMTYDLTFERS